MSKIFLLKKLDVNQRSQTSLYLFHRKNIKKTLFHTITIPIVSYEELSELSLLLSYFE
jgi:hypothetical protein